MPISSAQKCSFRQIRRATSSASQSTARCSGQGNRIKSPCSCLQLRPGSTKRSAYKVQCGHSAATDEFNGSGASFKLRLQNRALKESGRCMRSVGHWNGTIHDKERRRGQKNDIAVKLYASCNTVCEIAWFRGSGGENDKNDGLLYAEIGSETNVDKYN